MAGRVTTKPNQTKPAQLDTQRDAIHRSRRVHPLKPLAQLDPKLFLPRRAEPHGHERDVRRVRDVAHVPDTWLDALGARGRAEEEGRGVGIC